MPGKLQPVNDHEIVHKFEVLDLQIVRIAKLAAMRKNFHAIAQLVEIAARDIRIAETEFLAFAEHVAKLVDGADVGAWAAKWRQVCDDGVCLIHQCGVGAENAPRQRLACNVGKIAIKRKQPFEAIARANIPLELADASRIGKKHVGAGQIKLHGRRTSRCQARFTAPIFSRPSASNTFATMPFESSPAFAYIAFGESWSMNV